MAQHRFLIGLSDEQGNVAGTQCARCSQIVLFENGKIPDDILKQECPSKREAVNQAAARIVKTVTEK